MPATSHQRVQLLPLASRGAATYNVDDVLYGARGLLLFLNLTAGAGGGTLDVKVQVSVNREGAANNGDTEIWFDVVGAAFTQKVAASPVGDYLEIYPHLVESNNKKVSFVMPTRYRVVCVVGTAAMTFSLEKEILW